MTLDELKPGRAGLSIQAIRKHIAGKYLVNVTPNNSHHFKKGLEKAIMEDSIVRVTGVGMTGSFRLPPKSKKRSPPAALSSNGSLRGAKKSPPQNVEEELSEALGKVQIRSRNSPPQPAPAAGHSRNNKYKAPAVQKAATRKQPTRALAKTTAPKKALPVKLVNLVPLYNSF